jgi:dGTPase
LAEKCIADQPELSAYYCVDPAVVEAACLAHDLGHPPFGHAGEHILNKLVSQADKEGFEGNPQTFRILTKLAVRYDDYDGLDLTRATLAACLKYPWYRNVHKKGRKKKWGAYRNEREDFEFAREGLPDSLKSPEAELMDWADDIAYSVHDLEDFHRCSAIPWHIVLNNEGEELLVEAAAAAWPDKPSDAENRLKQAFKSLAELLTEAYGELLNMPYVGERWQRAQLRGMTSDLVRRYILETRLSESGTTNSVLSIPTELCDEVRILKQITRDYIIATPALAAQQKGQEYIINQLFSDILGDSKEDELPKYLPKRLVYLWDDESTSTARKVADCLATMTEAEVIALYSRLRGVAFGSVLDPILR